MPNVLPRVAAGETDAMDECLKRYGGLVWTLANRMVRHGDVEDAIQEVFVEIWRVAERFDDSKGKESTFVAMIARRRLIDRQRSSARQIETLSLQEPTPAQAQEDGLESMDEAQRVRTMLGKLRSDERRVIELAIDFGMSQSEIAEATGMRIGTVKTNARRGMLRLRELMTKSTVGDRPPIDHQTKGGLR